MPEAELRLRSEPFGRLASGVVAERRTADASGTDENPQRFGHCAPAAVWDAVPVDRAVEHPACLDLAVKDVR